MASQRSFVVTYKSTRVLVHGIDIHGHILKPVRHVVGDQVIWQALPKVQRLVLQGKLDEFNPRERTQKI